MNAQTKVKADTLTRALVAAQAELHAPAKNRTVQVKLQGGGSYSFDYATLDAIVEMLRPVLTKHGLWFVQFAADGAMVTRIIHEGGEFMDCGIPMPSLPPKPQEAGSLITYFKRYSLCAAFGLVAEEDDDANVAQGNTVARKNGKDKEAPFPQGPAKNKTELKSIGRDFWREVEGCGDPDELSGLLASHKELQTQIATALPIWWNGGRNDSGEPFEGLAAVIARKQTELTSDDWRTNPLSGG